MNTLLLPTACNNPSTASQYLSDISKASQESNRHTMLIKAAASQTPSLRECVPDVVKAGCLLVLSILNETLVLDRSVAMVLARSTANRPASVLWIMRELCALSQRLEAVLETLPPEYRIKPSEPRL